MSQHEKQFDDSDSSRWTEEGPSRTDGLEILGLAEAHTEARDQAAAAIIDELSGPLTALLIYIAEIRERSFEFPEAGGNRAYLQQIAENALQQTERVCALVKQIADARSPQGGASFVPQRAIEFETPASYRKTPARDAGGMFANDTGRKPLTRREREVLDLISEGHSNKQGALRMGISPRTFESHRAEAMRKLGARNTADLVRKALSYQG